MVTRAMRGRRMATSGFADFDGSLRLASVRKIRRMLAAAAPWAARRADASTADGLIVRRAPYGLREACP
jgi:hypothetical protein